MGFQQWIYHKTEDPKIIDSDNFGLFQAQGWRDSPAEFINMKDFGVDSGDAIAVQQLGDTVQGVVDALNGALNIDTMDMDALAEYAGEHFGQEIDIAKDIEELRIDVLDMIEGKKSEVTSIIAGMSKAALETYALERFNVNLDKRKGEEKLRAEVQALIDGNGE